MPSPPFLKSNRVEDIRDVLGQIYRSLGLSKGGVAATAVTASSGASIAVGRGKPGNDGVDGQPGKDGLDGKDGASLAPVFTRSINIVPLTTSTGDLISNRLGYLVTVRSLDEVPIFDSQNKVITE